MNGFPFENGKPLVYVFAWGSHIYLLISLCLLARHQDKDQWDQFHLVFASNICIDGPKLGKGVVAQLEGTTYDSGLGFAEELKLFLGGKDEMASTVDSDICLKEAIRNVILFQTEIQVYWVFGPGVLSKPICSLGQ